MPTPKMTKAEQLTLLGQLKAAFLSYYAITEESFALIEAMSKFRVLQKDEMLLSEGTIAKQLHFVGKGAVRAYIADKDGNLYNKNIFLEGDFAGSKVSMLLQEPSSFALQALEDCWLISLDFKQYRALIDTRDDMKNFYIAYLEKNWVIAKEQREISLVMENAKTRYLKLIGRHPSIIHRIPLQHIASHLGITPTQLSRIRKELKENH